MVVLLGHFLLGLKVPHYSADGPDISSVVALSTLSIPQIFYIISISILLAFGVLISLCLETSSSQVGQF